MALYAFSPGDVSQVSLSITDASFCIHSALLCLVAFAMALAAGPVLHLEASSTRIQILRLYGIFIAAILMLVETESPWVLERMRVLESWVGRALLQGLVCCMTPELATSEGDTDFDMSIRLYRQVGIDFYYCS